MSSNASGPLAAILDALDEHESPHRLRLSFGGVTALIAHERMEVAEAARQELGHHCRVEPAGEEVPGAVRVSATTDAASWAAAAEAVGHEADRGGCDRIRVFAGRAGAIRIARDGVVGLRVSPGGTVVLLDSERRRLAVLQPDPGRIASDTIEIVRGQLVMAWAAATSTIVHASACRLRGGAILFFGESGAGKTSSLLALLAAGAEFVSNDRVALTIEGGHVMVRGLPYPVTVGAGTARTHARLGTAMSLGLRDGKLPLQPHDIKRLLGARTCASAPLALLMRPRLDAGDGVPQTVQLDRHAAERELTANVHAFRSELAPGNWSGWFPMRSDPAADDAVLRAALDAAPVHELLFRRGDPPDAVAAPLLSLTESELVRA